MMNPTMNKAYSLLAYLRNLKLVGQNFEGELEWVGRNKDWDNVVNEIETYESGNLESYEELLGKTKF